MGTLVSHRREPGSTSFSFGREQVGTRKLYLVAGYTSLFHYLFEGLRMSDHAAYNRMQVARAARRYPALELQAAQNQFGRDHMEQFTRSCVSDSRAAGGGPTCGESLPRASR